MGWLQFLLVVGKFVFKWFGVKIERDKEKKEKKQKALKEVGDGIKEKDPSKITAGFDKLSRI
ncbi:hypothetical protein DRJ16_06755 [Candidatus Woesearchaeota archaeon]|nr:MAG: hypothetical protein DRJ16_06755 [Candidatus Woesearchaeota archaeon]